MIQTPFPNDDDKPKQPHLDEGYILRHRHARTLNPVSRDLVAPHTARPKHPGTPHDQGNPAVELIRRKVEALYAEEPKADEEIAVVEQVETQTTHPQHSRHQAFMQQLSTSGKSLAQIQTDWHNYYVALSDEEKHAVWQEFYAANNRQSAHSQYAAAQQPTMGIPAAVSQLPALPSAMRPTSTHYTSMAASETPTAPRRSKREAGAIKKRILETVAAGDSRVPAKAKQHIQSLFFGLASAFVVLVLFFFSFFNEMIIAPFIQPSRHVSATPIIVDADSVAPSNTPEVIVPKINVQIPVVYDEPSMEEAKIQAALERGTVHYPITPKPGEQGNVAVFGHSSNNIFNKGQYKFAFVQLRQLVPGDLFYLTYDNKVYAYRVFEKRVVPPSETSVLSPVSGKTATAALITCDPPGTSTNRLVVWGEQISPDPAGATAPTNVTPSDTPAKLPSEAPTLWSRITGWFSN